MNEISAHDTLESLRARARRSPRLRELSPEISEGANGRVVLRVDPPEHSANPNGSIHGGFLFSLCDTTCAYACLSQNDNCVTQSAHITFLKPGKLGERLTITACEVARTRRSQTYDAKITNPAGETLAIFRGIFQLMPKAPPKA